MTAPVHIAVRCALAAPWLGWLAFVSSEPELAAVARAGDRVTCRFEWALEVETESACFEVRGPDGTAESGELPPTTHVETLTVEHVDEVLAAEEGRATRLRRTFVQVLGRCTSRTPEISADVYREGRGCLDGEAVLFTRRPDGDGFVAELETDPADAEVLKRLRMDTDLRGLLPDGDVAVGATWDVDVDLLRELWDPGGAAAYPRGDGEHAFLAGWLAGDLTGELKARHAGRPSVDGTEVVLLRLEGRAALDRAPWECEGPVFGGLGYVEGTNRVTQRAELVIEGEACWDPGAGRLVDADVRMEIVLDLRIDSALWGRETTVSERLRGDLRARVSF